MKSTGWNLSAALLVTSLPAMAALVPSSTQTLSQAICVDSSGRSHQLRVVRYEYDDHPGMRRGTIRSEVIALEEGSVEDCSIRRLWQDYRVIMPVGSLTAFSSSLSCGPKGETPLLFVVASTQRKLSIQAYSVSMSESVAEKFPTSRMHERKCIDAKERPRPLGGLLVDMPQSSCGVKRVEVLRVGSKSFLTIGREVGPCKQEELGFDLKMGIFVDVPKGWKLLKPLAVPERGVCSVDEESSSEVK